MLMPYHYLKKSYVKMASLAEKIGRYQDMAMLMSHAVYAGSEELTDDERKLATVAYENVVIFYQAIEGTLSGMNTGEVGSEKAEFFEGYASSLEEKKKSKVPKLLGCKLVSHIGGVKMK
ncbi:hypothetical protein RND81_09G189500 [Saponaria officinalis]|uniref:Uncharacterized protein n=1 Tax=Saponaria officinalis TaxID=3572 RepID=A0AAW1IP10_SAPOF